MARITQQVKAIADAHIQARKSGLFDNTNVNTIGELYRELRLGKTFEELMNEVEVRYCSTTSILMSRHQSYTSKAYKSRVYYGFKTILSNI